MYPAFRVGPTISNKESVGPKNPWKPAFSLILFNPLKQSELGGYLMKPALKKKYYHSTIFISMMILIVSGCTEFIKADDKKNKFKHSTILYSSNTSGFVNPSG